MKTKVIVVTGGVYSSLGKGIIASSLGCILKHGNFTVAMLKLDPYLNTDPGLLSPFQHGEVFITEDGQKADLDLGHYERFTGQNLNGASTTTSGKLYTELLKEEQTNKFDGATIQIIPHLTNKIIEKIEYAIKKNKQPDFLVIEIGGTVGDIEGLPFIEALRIYQARHQNVLFVHCSPLFQLSANDEIKTKPTQHSIKNIRNLGITPHILILRYKEMISKHEKNKLSWTCDVKEENIFISQDCQYLYEVPKVLFQQGVHKSIMQYFGIKKYSFNMKDWDLFLSSIFTTKKKTLKICICGKYTGLNDAYLSLIESLKIASYQQKLGLEIELLESDHLTADNFKQKLAKFDAFVVPDGTGTRGIKQMQFIAQYCQTHNKPYLGIKLGMQVMVDYFSQKNTTNKTPLTIAVDKPEKFLGQQPIHILKNTIASKIYAGSEINERHWNTWVLNPQLIKTLPNLIVSGVGYQNHAEIIEVSKHKCFMGILFHPEFSSKPNKPDPIFSYFLKTAAQ